MEGLEAASMTTLSLFSYQSLGRKNQASSLRRKSKIILIPPIYSQLTVSSS